jgi:hypothetical protein
MLAYKPLAVGQYPGSLITLNAHTTVNGTPQIPLPPWPTHTTLVGERHGYEP